jgi:hypothetical protein
MSFAEEMVVEALRAAKQAGIPDDAALFWFCKECDPADDPHGWRMVYANSPLVKDGRARCPDCGGDLTPADTSEWED